MHDFWVVTASADHAARARQEGIVQACHGKAAPLRRMRPGDGVVIYSPRQTFPQGDMLQAFSAIGRVGDGNPRQHDMGGGFLPWRRSVRWEAGAQPAPIRPLLERLELTRGEAAWGMAFRFGLRRLSAADFARVAEAMGVSFS